MRALLLILRSASRPRHLHGPISYEVGGTKGNANLSNGPRALTSAFVRFSSHFHENFVVTPHTSAGVFLHNKNSQGADPKNEHRNVSLTVLLRGTVCLLVLVVWFSFS